MPFARRKPVLALDVETRGHLETLSVSRTAPAAQVERARMLLAFADGSSVAAIARQLRTNRVRVNDTVNRALQVGPRTALSDLPRSGRPRRIAAEDRTWVTELACQKPPALGYAQELWTTALLAQHVRQHCAAAGHPALAQLGRGTVCKILAANAVQPHRIEYYLERRDPDFEAKMAQVLHVYKQIEVRQAQVAAGAPAPLEAVLSYDEKPGIQVLENVAPDLLPVPGIHPTIQRDHEYVRHGTLSLLCGIDLLTGKLLAQVHPRHRSREFVAWLKQVHAAYPPAWRIRLILDNHSAHISQETRAYLTTVPNRFEFTFTPKHGSWLNLVEVFFAKLARTLLRGIRADTPAQLKHRIEQHIEALNREPVVFRWKYGLEEIALS